MPLTRERIVDAAIRVADSDGLGALTMRRLGQELGVEAMALYRHLPNKEAILDAVVDTITDSVATPSENSDWRALLEDRAQTGREVFTAHSWAIGLLEGRAMGPATMRALDATLGRLRAAGFAIDDAAHALWLVDSFVYGHVIQEVSAGSPSSTDPDIAAGLEDMASGDLPHLAELGERALGGTFSYDEEFERGLESILDAVARRREA